MTFWKSNQTNRSSFWKVSTTNWQILLKSTKNRMKQWWALRKRNQVGIKQIKIKTQLLSFLKSLISSVPKNRTWQLASRKVEIRKFNLLNRWLSQVCCNRSPSLIAITSTWIKVVERRFLWKKDRAASRRKRGRGWMTWMMILVAIPPSTQPLMNQIEAACL
jgi:hypothetical protein